MALLIEGNASLLGTGIAFADELARHLENDCLRSVFPRKRKEGIAIAGQSGAQ
jgi:hypothetical protein